MSSLGILGSFFSKREGGKGGGGGSAYQDWTAQVEKTPGILVLMCRPREVPVPSLMIDEEVNKGLALAARLTHRFQRSGVHDSATAYQAWRMEEG